MSYFEPKSFTEASFTEKGSKFIGVLLKVQDSESAKRQLSELRTLHPKANHHCYAYRHWDENGNLVENLSDDGEPTNTAGQPILKQIQSESLINCMIVVIRYFGGTKLGVGGLIKAYRGAAKDVLANTKKEAWVETILLKYHCPYEKWGELVSILDRNQIDFEAEHLKDGIVVSFEVESSAADTIEKLVAPIGLSK